MVRRDVIRLVTPGTLTEDALLDAVAKRITSMALAPRAGGGAERRATRSPGSTSRPATSASPRPPRTGLPPIIVRIDPRELIVAEPVFRDAALKPLFDMLGRVASAAAAGLFDSAPAPQPRRRASSASTTLDGFGAFSRAELSASAARIAYVEKTQKAERPPLSRARARGERRHAVHRPGDARQSRADCARCRASREGSLLAAIDRTVTGAGARLLAERLMAPLTDPGAIDRRLDAVAFFVGRPDSADALRDGLEDGARHRRARCRGWRSTAAARATSARSRGGLAAAAAIADAAGGDGRCRPSSPRRATPLAALPARSARSSSTGRSPTNCRS